MCTLHVSDLRTGNPIARRFVDAAAAAGYRRNDDFNGPDQEGVGPYQVTQYNGERWNATRAYLHGGDKTDATYNRGRRQLTVLPDTQALRIVFEGKRATGVVVDCQGSRETDYSVSLVFTEVSRQAREALNALSQSALA